MDGVFTLVTRTFKLTSFIPIFVCAGPAYVTGSPGLQELDGPAPMRDV